MRGILFDLDGTLLDIDLTAFLRRYFHALDRAASHAFPDVDLISVISMSTDAMMQAHPGLTNREAFYADFLVRTGRDLDEEWEVFEAFYRDVFPTLGGGAGAARGARGAIEAALGLGLRVAVATNPIFPMAAVRHRMAWAGIADLDIPVVTAYEEMHATKPLPAYFRETAELLGVDPKECLMVGDDPVLDLAAADVGMRTFFVGRASGALADFRGDLVELAALLPRLTEER
jgi:FMN phosphatase YigB (HAD superfamily)